MLVLWVDIFSICVWLTECKGFIEPTACRTVAHNDSCIDSTAITANVQGNRLSSSAHSRVWSWWRHRCIARHGQLAGGENAAADNEVAEADAALSLAFSHFIDTDLLLSGICPPLESLLEAPTSCFAAICWFASTNFFVAWVCIVYAFAQSEEPIKEQGANINNWSEKPARMAKQRVLGSEEPKIFYFKYYIERHCRNS